MHDGQVLAGFAGSAADALTLFAKFEAKLEEYRGQPEARGGRAVARTGAPTASCAGWRRMLVVLDRAVHGARRPARAT